MAEFKRKSNVVGSFLFLSSSSLYTIWIKIDFTKLLLYYYRTPLFILKVSMSYHSEAQMMSSGRFASDNNEMQ